VNLEPLPVTHRAATLESCRPLFALSFASGAKRTAVFPSARPTPNWSPSRAGVPSMKWTSTTFSLCTSRPFSS
jgi:hypothetical protein